MPSYALPEGPVPALTSDPVSPVILYPSLFGPGRLLAMPCL